MRRSSRAFPGDLAPSAYDKERLPWTSYGGQTRLWPPGATPEGLHALAAAWLGLGRYQVLCRDLWLRAPVWRQPSSTERRVAAAVDTRWTVLDVG